MRQTRNGFTLVEVIIAALVIAGGLLVVAGVMGNSARQARSGGITTQAPLIAQQTFEELKATQASGGSVTCGPSTTTHTVDNVTYTIDQVITPQALVESTGTLEAISCPAPNPDAYTVVLNLSWQVDGITQTAEYTEILSTENLAEPRIDEFEATSINFNTLGYIEHPTDPARNSVTLNWDIPVGGQPLAVSITSDPPGVVNATDLPATGDLTFSATQSVMLTLTVDNAVGTDTRTIPVTTTNAITSFTARSNDATNPAYTGPLDDITLAWQLRSELHPALEYLVLERDFPAVDLTGSTNITTVPNPATRVEQVQGSVTGNRELTWTLNYYIRTGPDLSGSTRIAQETVTLNYLGTPQVQSFSVTPSAMCQPAAAVPVSLAYSVRGGIPGNPNLRINAPGYTFYPTSVTGTAHASAASSVTYTLTARNNAGRQATATTTVTLHPPAQVSLSATPTNPLDGTPFTVTWTVTNAASRLLNGTSVPASGLQTHAPNTASSQAFTLVATTSHGCITTETLSVPIRTFAAPAFDISLPSTGATGTAGDTLNYTWNSSPGINSSYHRVELLRNGSVVQDITSGNGTIVLSGPTGAQTYAIRIVQRSTNRVLATSAPRTITNAAAPATPALTLAGTHGTTATAGDTVRFTLNTPSGFNSNLHTLQYQLPGSSSWTNTSPGASFTHTQANAGDAIVRVRVISRNGSRSLRSASATVTFAPAPSITSVAWNRTSSTSGDNLTLTASISNLNSNLHQLQRALSGTTNWQNVNASSSLSPTATGSTVYSYRVINKLAGAPSNGRVYSTRNSNTLTVYAQPTLNTCSINPTSVYGAAAITINAVNTGFRSDLHTLQWRRSNHSATGWANFTGNSISTTTPNVLAGGTATYQVRVANRHAGTFTNITRSCNVTLLAQPAMNGASFPSGNHYRGDTVTLSWSAASRYNSSIHRYEWRLSTSGTWTNAGNNRTASVTLPNSTSATYQVRVVNRSNGHVFSTASVSISPRALPTLSGFGNRTVRSNAAINLSWSRSGYVNADFYTGIRRGTSGGFTNIGDAASYSANRIANNGAPANYTYQVAIFRNDGRQVAITSNTVTVNPPAPTISNLSRSVTQLCTVNAAIANRRSVVSWSLGAGTTIASVTANNGASVSGSGNSRTITVANNNSNTVTVTVNTRNAAGETRAYTTTITRAAAPSISSFTIDNSTSTLERMIHSNVVFRWGTSNAARVQLNGTTVTGTSSTQSVGTTTGLRTHTLTAVGNANCASASVSRTINVKNQVWIRMAAVDRVMNARNDLPSSSNAINVLAGHTSVINVPAPTGRSSLTITFTGPALAYVSSRRSASQIDYWAGRWNNNGYIHTWHRTVGFPSSGRITLSSGTWSGWYSMGTQYAGTSGSRGTQVGSHNRVRMMYSSAGYLYFHFSNESGKESFSHRFSGSPNDKYVTLGYTLRVTIH